MKKSTSQSTAFENKVSDSKTKPLQALIDLVVFLAVMFLVRTFTIEALGFWGNTIFKTVSTVGVATLLLYYRKQSWKDLGLTTPNKWMKLLGVVGVTLVCTVAMLMIFEVVIRDALFEATESTGKNTSAFEDVSGGKAILISTLVFVWIESFLEELQDRGFSLNRFESIFVKTPWSTIVAVLIQAVIFGFRHSYDLSPRSITTGLIGLVFGVIYVTSGRNLWPLILAHIFLNTMSMIEKYT